MSEKYCIFHVQGGLGKHIAATAVAKAIKNNHPDRKLIVVCVYTESFLNLDWVDRVYQLGSTQYFYQEYIENKDSLIFYNEPYFTTDHIHKRLPLAQTWCKMYGVEYNGEQPEIVFNKLQREISGKHWRQGNKPIMVIHTNGGIHNDESRKYCWARDMPLDITQQIVDKYHKKYTIYQVCKQHSDKLVNAHIVDQPMTNMELFSLILNSDKRILIDSCLQHAAAAMNLPSIVLWNGTSPVVFGHDLHTNIIAKKPGNFKLPGSLYFDFDFMGQEHEYPYTKDVELFSLDEIVKAIGDDGKVADVTGLKNIKTSKNAVKGFGS